MFDSSFREPHPLPATVKIMLAVWGAILALWLPFFALMGAGMVFDGGYTFRVYLFVFQVWAYPALVAAAYFFRRRKPTMVWLPAFILVPTIFEMAFNL